MHPQFAPLFQPLRLNNGVLLKNRLAVAPMTHWASRPDGSISDAERLFLSGRAQNFGLFVTAATLVSPEGKAFAGEPYAFDDSHSDSLRQRRCPCRRAEPNRRLCRCLTRFTAIRQRHRFLTFIGGIFQRHTVYHSLDHRFICRIKCGDRGVAEGKGITNEVYRLDIVN